MISKRLRYSLDHSVSVRDIFETGKILAEKYGPENVFNFSIGNPSVEPPAIVNETIKSLVDAEPPLSLHSYPANVGYPEVRRHIAEELNAEFGCAYEESGIIMTAGAAAAISLICATLLDRDDEVVVFTPYFWEYRNYVQTLYGRLVLAESRPDTFQPDARSLESVITERTRFLLMNTPNNPTGAVYTAESIRAVADVLRRKEREYGHPIYIVSDEPYRRLAYGVEVPWISKFYRDTFVVYSYSKALSIPGERIGYIAMEPDIADYEDLIEGLTAAIRFLGYVNAPSLQQKLLLKCSSATVDVEIYRRSRDILYDNLTAMGYTCVRPDGAFYLFLKSLEPDELAFCERAKGMNILFAPGSVFEHPGWVRISYCVPEDTARHSLPVFQKLYDSYR